MSLVITLNIILAVFILVAVVAPLAWAIRSAASQDRVLAARSRRRVRAAAPAGRPVGRRLVAGL